MTVTTSLRSSRLATEKMSIAEEGSGTTMQLLITSGPSASRAISLGDEGVLRVNVVLAPASNCSQQNERVAAKKRKFSAFQETPCLTSRSASRGYG
jgi:hypothetical protein